MHHRINNTKPERKFLLLLFCLFVWKYAIIYIIQIQLYNYIGISIYLQLK